MAQHRPDSTAPPSNPQYGTDSNYAPLNQSHGGILSPLSPPTPQFAPYQDSVHDSYASRGASSPFVNDSTSPLSEKQDAEFSGARDNATSPAWRRRVWIFVVAGVIIVVAAIAIPVVLVSRNNTNDNNSNNSNNSENDTSGQTSAPEPSSTPVTPQAAITGGDGSEVTTEDGTKFTYVNQFGGYWVSDPDNPWNDGARPNSWTPALNESWDYSRNRIYG